MTSIVGEKYLKAELDYGCGNSTIEFLSIAFKLNVNIPLLSGVFVRLLATERAALARMRAQCMLVRKLCLDFVC